MLVPMYRTYAASVAIYMLEGRIFCTNVFIKGRVSLAIGLKSKSDMLHGQSACSHNMGCRFDSGLWQLVEAIGGLYGPCKIVYDWLMLQKHATSLYENVCLYVQFD